MPCDSERAASTFYLIQLQQLEGSVARRVSHFTPSCEAQNASSSGAPMPSPSEQATSAFYLITKFGFLLKLWRPSTKRTVPDFARITRDCVVPTLPLN